MALAPCKDCGAEPVNHGLMYAAVAIDETLRPLFSSGRPSILAGLVYAFERSFSPLLMQFFLATGLAKGVQEPDEKTLLLAKVIWEEAARRNITMVEVRLFGLARNLFLARLPDGRQFAFEGMPLPPRSMHQAWWLDNKAEMKKRFRKLGLPVAGGGSVASVSGARALFAMLSAPVIVKPYSGSGSRHTTLHIKDEEGLTVAVRSALQVAPLAIVEEELIGPVYRATVVDGRLVGVLRRDPPHVIGDGVRTIAELIEEANEHPARSGPYFSKMSITEEAKAELMWQGLTENSVPEKGRRITLHQKVNWSLGGTTADETDETHSDNRDAFERAAEALAAPLVGIDFIIDDIRHSYKETPRSGIIECNSMPFFDNHHLPFSGKPRDVAGAIWDMYLGR